ncbi:RNA-binding 39 isoform X2 [Pelobates cultripes]|uniref:RNA-binding 39 isoform X2 n=1 Tax=Pelobates cultripes TaxID=61616 RepID=A0AAD1W5C9_PELCU|nr:RNA-binding 39 isoform X2 [Pelobates cultripes]
MNIPRSRDRPQHLPHQGPERDLSIFLTEVQKQTSASSSPRSRGRPQHLPHQGPEADLNIFLTKVQRQTSASSSPRSRGRPRHLPHQGLEADLGIFLTKVQRQTSDGIRVAGQQSDTSDSNACGDLGALVSAFTFAQHASSSHRYNYSQLAALPSASTLLIERPSWGRHRLVALRQIYGNLQSAILQGMGLIRPMGLAEYILAELHPTSRNCRPRPSSQHTAGAPPAPTGGSPQRSTKMADDFDIEAMLEAPYRKDENKVNSANGHEERSKKKKKSKSRSRSRERKRSRSKERKRSKDRERKSSKSRERKRSRSKERKKSRSRSRERRFRGHYRSPYSGPKFGSSMRGKIGAPHSVKIRRRSKSRSPQKKDKSPVREPIDNLTPEERDARTVFCMQLAARIRPRDLEEFFSTVGKVRDVRMISDRNSRRSKGIAYVEFVDVSSVPLAIGLTGQRVLGVPIIVQASQAEKNRAAAMANNLQKGTAGPMRLYVGSLHFNITEDMLRGIFEPFGRIESIQLMMDSETGRSKGYGFITFSDSECAKKALEQLNGFELAGRPMKVGHVTERTDASNASSFLDSDELERTGIDLGTTGRLQLMARLAEGTGLQIPPAAQQALQMSGSLAFGAVADLQSRISQQSEALAAAAASAAAISLTATTLPAAPAAQPLATQCFQLSNMFNPQTEDEPGWDTEIKDDVIEECNKHGGVVHIYVDKNSPQVCFCAPPHCNFRH